MHVFNILPINYACIQYIVHWGPIRAINPRFVCVFYSFIRLFI